MTEILAVATTIWGVVLALAPLLQLRVIVKHRDASGVSAAWVLILLIGSLLWLSYGLVNDTIPLVIANGVSVVTVVALMITIAVYRRKPAGAPVRVVDES